MKITFLNVGQGDSIVIEWQKEDITKLCIIDCCKFKNKIPTIDYIQSLQDEIKKVEITYLILSHPHSDHYSGMKELIEHCTEQKIPIKEFRHTCRNHPTKDALLDRSIPKDICFKDLTEILLLVYELKKGSSNLKVNDIDNNVSLVLDELHVLSCIAPSNDDYDDFRKNYKIFEKQSIKVNLSKASNRIATFFELKNINQKYIILLTSDIEKKPLTEFTRTFTDEYQNYQVLLVQVPHHGSKKNHLKQFYQTINPEKESIPAVISVGDNSKDNLPDIKVIEDLSDLGYEVFPTNHVNGYSAYMSEKSKHIIALKHQKILNIDERAPLIKEGNQTFLIDSKLCLAIKD